MGKFSFIAHFGIVAGGRDSMVEEALAVDMHTSMLLTKADYNFGTTHPFAM